MVDLSFSEISRRLKELKLPEFDVVVGIARGGMAPALMIAHQYDREVVFITLNYRDDDNKPRHDEPVILSANALETVRNRKVLLVDDVSVSGKTLETARNFLNNNQTITFTLKGKADFVLFPEIGDCVNWPWKI